MRSSDAGPRSHCQRKSVQTVVWRTSPYTYPPVVSLEVGLGPILGPVSRKFFCTANSRMRSVIASATAEMVAAVDEGVASPPLIRPTRDQGAHWSLSALSCKVSGGAV